jgi:hypothetical protein
MKLRTSKKNPPSRESSSKIQPVAIKRETTPTPAPSKQQKKKSYEVMQVMV